MKPIAAIVATLAGAALLPMHAHAATLKPQPAKYTTLAQLDSSPGTATARPDRIIPQKPGIDRDDHNRNGGGDRDYDRDDLRGRSGGTTPPGLDRDDHNRKGMGMDRDHEGRGDMDHDRDDMRGRSGGSMPPGLDRNDRNRNGGGDMDHDRDDVNGRAGATPDMNRH